ncbi:MAG: O-succinylhomoserine sulfhydrylase [Flavobacteriales bacterium]|nr:O-succinylhomoserine sulfhydrylase [Flavobacteriales bacterium]MCB9447740.1 O-succinylhomoserine sulfhydrylase [Flavobacteriales bacterium]
MSDFQEFETLAIRNQAEKTQFKEHAVPMFLTSSFTFDDAEEMRAAFASEIDRNIYSRFSNPNTSELVEKMCALEEAEAGFAFASGMAGIFASFAGVLKAGDHIVASRSIFGAIHTMLANVLSRFGITHTLVDADKPQAWEAAIQPNTRMIFLETPSNPGLDIVDLEWAGNLADKHNLILNVDNCFATPYLQRPMDYGAHIVSHSATKYIDGQGRVMGGVVVGRKQYIDEIYQFARTTGPSMSPFNAWVLSKSLETLAIRMERHCSNAHKLATCLDSHPEVEWVRYPFLTSHPQYEIAQRQMKLGGGIVTFQVKGGLERGKKFLDALEMASLTANLGDSRTIATHPASTTHSKLSDEERMAVGITPGLVRVSVGLENIIDIIKDIEQALERSK